MIITTSIMGIVKKIFVPARAIFFSSPEGSRLPESRQEVDNSSLENADASQVSEAAIIYKSNYRNLMEQINKYANSSNPRLAAIATKYRDILSTSLLDPSSVDVLQPKAQQENIKRISTVITNFSQDVRKASLHQIITEEPATQERGVNAPSWLDAAVSGLSSVKGADNAENSETLANALKRYRLVYNANYNVIQSWLEKVKKKAIQTENDADAVAKLQQYSKSFEEQFGGLNEAMFKDAVGVDRVIAGINDFMDKQVVPFYNDLTNKHSKIMAQQSREKTKNQS